MPNHDADPSITGSERIRRLLVGIVLWTVIGAVFMLGYQAFGWWALLGAGGGSLLTYWSES